jgi:hypothetical protein
VGPGCPAGRAAVLQLGTAQLKAKPHPFCPSPSTSKSHDLSRWASPYGLQGFGLRPQVIFRLGTMDGGQVPTGSGLRRTSQKDAVGFLAPPSPFPVTTCDLDIISRGRWRGSDGDTRLEESRARRRRSLRFQDRTPVRSQAAGRRVRHHGACRARPAFTGSCFPYAVAPDDWAYSVFPD